MADDTVRLTLARSRVFQLLALLDRYAATLTDSPAAWLDDEQVAARGADAAGVRALRDELVEQTARQDLLALQSATATGVPPPDETWPLLQPARLRATALHTRLEAVEQDIAGAADLAGNDRELLARTAERIAAGLRGADGQDSAAGVARQRTAVIDATRLAGIAVGRFAGEHHDGFQACTPTAREGLTVQITVAYLVSNGLVAIAPDLAWQQHLPDDVPEPFLGDLRDALRTALRLP